MVGWILMSMICKDNPRDVTGKLRMLVIIEGDIWIVMFIIIFRSIYSSSLIKAVQVSVHQSGTVAFCQIALWVGHWVVTIDVLKELV